MAAFIEAMAAIVALLLAIIGGAVAFLVVLMITLRWPIALVIVVWLIVKAA